MLATEHDIQATFVEWCEWRAIDWPELRCSYAIPNEGQRTKKARIKRLKEGMRRGMPDWCLPFRAGSFGALYLEFKTVGGRLSPEQKAMHAMLRENGNRVEVVRSVDEAISIVEHYLGGE